MLQTIFHIYNLCDKRLQVGRHQTLRLPILLDLDLKRRDPGRFHNYAASPATLQQCQSARRPITRRKPDHSYIASPAPDLHRVTGPSAAERALSGGSTDRLFGLLVEAAQPTAVQRRRPEEADRP